jgi:hypothetical protein
VLVGGALLAFLTKLLLVARGPAYPNRDRHMGWFTRGV